MTDRLEFDLESKLLSVLEDEARSRSNNPFAKDGAELVTVMRESAIGTTIPDLIIVRRLHNVAGKRVRLTGFQSWVMGEISRTGELSEVMLTRKLFSRIESTRVALTKLEKLGAVKRTAHGTFFVPTDLSRSFQIVSVEAKLTRWRLAIEQAKRYLRFSNESFIALPASVIARNQRIGERCAEAGIGLIAVTRTDASVVVHPGISADVDQRAWTWTLSKAGALTI